MLFERVSGEEYVMDDSPVWITVRNFSIRVRLTDEGVVVDIYGLGGEDKGRLASACAYFSEGPDDAVAEIEKLRAWVEERKRAGLRGYR